MRVGPRARRARRGMRSMYLAGQNDGSPQSGPVAMHAVSPAVRIIANARCQPGSGVLLPGGMVAPTDGRAVHRCQPSVTAGWPRPLRPLPPRLVLCLKRSARCALPLPRFWCPLQGLPVPDRSVGNSAPSNPGMPTLGRPALRDPRASRAMPVRPAKSIPRRRVSMPRTVRLEHGRLLVAWR